MANKPEKKPMGRPPREFDKKTFEGLCHVWCTWEEIENIMRCDRRSLDAWCKRTYFHEDTGEPLTFNDVYKRFSDGGKASLRRNQLHLSKTNAAMCIWLGKQKLGQRDIPQELEAFNGKLAVLLEKLGRVESKESFEEKKPEEKEIATK
jgi:hypothetical protein